MSVVTLQRGADEYGQLRDSELQNEIERARGRYSSGRTRCGSVLPGISHPHLVALQRPVVIKDGRRHAPFLMSGVRTVGNEGCAGLSCAEQGTWTTR